MAKAVMEANKILSEDEMYPTIISEFTVKTTLSASLEVEGYGENKAFEMYGNLPIAAKQRYKPIKLSSLRFLSPKERLITGYKEELGITIETRIVPLPRTVTPNEVK